MPPDPHENPNLSRRVLINLGVDLLDQGILEMIEISVGPVIAIGLYLLPTYAIHRFNVLKQYRGQASNTFVTIAAVTAVACIIYRMFIIGL